MLSKAKNIFRPENTRRLDRCPSPAGAGEGGRRPGEGRWEKANNGGEETGKVPNSFIRQ